MFRNKFFKLKSNFFYHYYYYYYLVLEKQEVGLVAHETHEATCHNWVTAGKTKQSF